MVCTDNSIWHNSTKAVSQIVNTTPHVSLTSKSFIFATPTFPANSTSCTEESKSASTSKPAMSTHFSHSPHGASTGDMTLTNREKTTLTYHHERKSTSSPEPETAPTPVQTWPWVLETTIIANFSHARHKSTMTWFSHLPTTTSHILVTRPPLKQSELMGKPINDGPRPTTTHAKCTTKVFEGKPFIFGSTSTQYTATATHTS